MKRLADATWRDNDYLSFAKDFFKTIARSPKSTKRVE
jgi:hypothetical protein